MDHCDNCRQHAKVEEMLKEFKLCSSKKDELWTEINDLKANKLSNSSFYAIVSLLLTIMLGITGYIAYTQNTIAENLSHIRADVAVNTDNTKEVKADLKELMR